MFQSHYLHLVLIRHIQLHNVHSLLSSPLLSPAVCVLVLSVRAVPALQCVFSLPLCLLQPPVYLGWQCYLQQHRSVAATSRFSPSAQCDGSRPQSSSTGWLCN